MLAGYRVVSSPYAGVYRRITWPGSPRWCLLPVRGGLPIGTADDSLFPESPPRTRGFTGHYRIPGGIQDVSSPYAGVYRLCPARRRRLAGLLPVRGGLPMATIIQRKQAESPPRTRGFTEIVNLGISQAEVSSPYAGVYRRLSGRSVDNERLLPVRGGLPATSLWAA